MGNEISMDWKFVTKEKRNSKITGYGKFTDKNFHTFMDSFRSPHYFCGKNFMLPEENPTS